MIKTLTPSGAPATDCLFAIAADLYQFMTSVQRPRPLDHDWMGSVQSRCVELRERALRLRERFTAQSQEIGASLNRIAENLREYGQDLESRATLAHLKHTQRGLAQGYEQLRVELAKDSSEALSDRPVPLHRLKTVNYKRNLFHVANGLGGALLYEYVLDFRQAMSLAIFVATSGILMEISRRFIPAWNEFLVGKVFHAIARPWEKHHINSATYYSVALVVIVGCFSRHAAEVGCLVLAISDPAATLAGRRWGERKLWKEKSLIGTGVFFLSAAATTFVFSTIWTPELALKSALIMAAIVAFGGAAVEALSDRFDDNFTIPVLCAGIASLWI